MERTPRLILVLALALAALGLFNIAGGIWLLTLGGSVTTQFIFGLFAKLADIYRL